MIWRTVFGFLRPLFKPFALLFGGWLARGQRETIKDLKAERKTRERMDNAPRHTDTDAADEWLRDRKRDRNL